MLRDPEKPNNSWDDLKAKLEPDRPFYSPGTNEVERDLYAIERCEKMNREAKKRPDMAGGYYYYCAEKEIDRD
jgi:hypothetical protein